MPVWAEHAYPTDSGDALLKIIKSINAPADPSTPTFTCEYEFKSRAFNSSPAPWKYKGCPTTLASDKSKRYVLPIDKLNVCWALPLITYWYDPGLPITVTVYVVVGVL